MLDAPLWGWLATIGAVLALLAVDFLQAARRPHAVGIREAAYWSVFYIGLAVAFGIGLTIVGGGRAGTEYFAGWLVEKSLSVDNLFVFVIIMSRFAVPAMYQQNVLLVGIAGALALRGVFIAVGAAAISRFSFTFVVFGVILIVTAVQLARHRNEDPDLEDNALLRLARRVLPASQQYDEGRLVTRVRGRRVVTPLFLVMVAIGSTDILFALDSIPAVFGVTQDAYIVFTANAFALLGLRALYFLISGLLDRLVYLSLGLAVILGFIGVKLILTFGHGVDAAVPHVPIALSLGFILTVLVVTTVASLVKVRREPSLRAHGGSIRWHGPRPEATAPDAATDGAATPDAAPPDAATPDAPPPDAATPDAPPPERPGIDPSRRTAR